MNGVVLDGSTREPLIFASVQVEGLNADPLPTVMEDLLST